MGSSSAKYIATIPQEAGAVKSMAALPNGAILLACENGVYKIEYSCVDCRWHIGPIALREYGDAYNAEAHAAAYP